MAKRNTPEVVEETNEETAPVVEEVSTKGPVTVVFRDFKGNQVTRVTNKAHAQELLKKFEGKIV